MKLLGTYFDTVSEKFLTEDAGTYKDLGEPKLSIMAFTRKTKEEGMFN